MESMEGAPLMAGDDQCGASQRTGDGPGIDRVAVLMAVYNGAAFLQEQLDTLAAQTVGGVDLWVSDDGSSDGSDAILARNANEWRRGGFRVFDGPGAGFAENFRSLMVRDEIDADYFAFCDQDDLWDADKLTAGVGWLKANAAEGPGLYCTRTRTMTIDGRTEGFSPLFSRPPGFVNAIVQSIAGANTMVMNRQAWALVREASRRTCFVSHDWWCYLIVSGAGGVVHYSPEARIGYRQHPGNLVGQNHSLRARIGRIDRMLAGRFVEWNDANLAGLRACEDLLSPAARDTLAAFAAARQGGVFARLAALRRSGAYRQTLAGQLALYAACLLGRV